MRNHRTSGLLRRGQRLVVVGAVIALGTVVSSPAQAVTIGSATTNFEVEATALVAANATHSEWIVPGASPATDWAGSGIQAVPNLMVFNDSNYSGVGATVPTNLSPAAIQGSCAGGSDDGFASGEKIKSHPIVAAVGTPSADKADICQVFTGYETATNSVNGGQDVIFYLGFTANGNANSTGSVKFWYELNQADDVANVGNYRTVGDVLIGFQYVGGSAGTVDAYTWSGADWTSITLPTGTYATSTPSGVAFAELAINLTSSGVLPRPVSPTGCKSFVAGRGMTSASAQTTSAGKDGTAVYPLTNAVSTCGQIRVTKQTLPEDPNSATVGYPGNAAFGTFPIQISGGPSGATTLIGSAADNSTVGFVELYGSGYTVTETSTTTGFTATSFTCTKSGVAVGTTAGNFMSVSGLSASSTPTECVVTNAKNPSLSIKKQSTGPTGSFNFNLYSSSNLTTALSGSPLAISTATTNPNTTAWPSSLTVGSYVLKEANPSPTHLLTSLKCTVTKGDASTAVVTTGDLTNGVAFTVAGGDAVLCEAFNKGDLSITISKTTLPAGGTGFGFTSSTTPATFTLDDTSTQVFSGLSAGNYTFTEDAKSGYYLKAINCSGTAAANITKDLTARSVTVAGVIGEDVSCEFVNEKFARVSVTKSVTGVTGTWTFDFSLSPAGSNTNPRAVTNASPTTTWIDLLPGSFTMTEQTVPSGYAAGTLTCGSASASATAGVTFTLAAGDNLACTAGNVELGSLTINKQTAPDGSTQSFAFTTTSLTPAGFNLADDGTRAFGDLAPGTYGVDETAVTGWTLSPVTCTGVTASVVTQTATGISVALAAGEDVVCTFQSNKTPHLKVIKAVVNDDGGDAADEDFELTVEPLGVVTTGVTNNVVAGTEYVVGEVPFAGYELTGIECLNDMTSAAVGTVADGQATLTLASGDDVTCTITNDDIAPQLTVVKNVVTDDGGDEGEDDFALSIVGVGVVSSGVPETVEANVDYTVSEDLSGLGGYEQVGIECVDDVTAAPLGVNGAVTLVEGQNVTCTVTNDDIAPTLTIIKDVVTDDGGDEVAGDFELLVTPEVSVDPIVSGDQHMVTANLEYTVSETLLDGYAQTSIECVDDDTDLSVGSDGVLALAEGQNVTCTVTNDDVAPSLTVVKDLVVDDGGNEVVADFELSVESSSGALAAMSGTSMDMSANVEYTVSEVLLDGYEQTSLACVDDDTDVSVGVDGVLTLAEGQDVTCTITNDDIAPALTVIKDVVTDDGGDEMAGDFELLVTPEVSVDPIASGYQHTVEANVEYTVSETLLDGYEQTSIECVDDDTDVSVGVDGVLTLAEGQAATCTITNDDVAPTLTVIKDLITDDGGDEVVADFALTVEASSGVLEATSGASIDLAANVEYTVSEAQLDGYEQTSLECVDDVSDALVGTDGVLTLNEGQNVTCTIINNDVAPTLTVVKEVDNGDGGNAEPGDFTLSVIGFGLVNSGDPESVEANVEYTVSEDLAGIGGYEQVSVECVDDRSGDPVGLIGSVVLAEGQSVTCTILNDDVAPKLTVIKKVVADNGGNEVAADFELSVLPLIAELDIVSGTQYLGLSNTEYTVSETALDGYAQTSIACVDDSTSASVGAAGVLTMDEGQNVTCTITNDDIAPRLKVVKSVVNDNGGEAVVGDFELSVESSAGSLSVTSDVTETVDANVEYTVSEVQLDGYEQTSLECVDDDTATAVGVDGVLTLDEGQNVTCTIINNDIAPKLTVIKKVVADNGGDEVVADFVLSVLPAVSVDPIESGTQYEAEANVAYTVAETQRAGYAQTSLTCIDDDTSMTVGSAGVVTLAEGQNVTCTLTNNDVAPTLKVVKSVVNDNGGNAVVTDFPLSLTSSAGSVSVTSGVAKIVDANVEFTVSETRLVGYAQTSLKCVDDDSSAAVGVDGVLTLAEGQNVTCTMTNDDIAPTLTVEKNLTVNDGGNEVVADFALSVAPSPTGNPIISGTTYAATSNVVYTVSETQRAGYTQTSLMCIDDDTSMTVGAAGVLTLAEGQNVTCTITNNDVAPMLKVVKSVINDNGGSAAPGDFALSASSSFGATTMTSGVAVNVRANVAYTISETLLAGYSQTSLVCVDDATSMAVGVAGVVTLAEGQNVTCTITNDDIAAAEYIDLSITKRDLSDDVLAGTSVVYEFVVDNVGSASPTGNATVTDQLPSELRWISSPLVSAPAGVTCAAPVGQQLSCTIPASLLDPSDGPVVLQVQASVPGEVRPTTVRNLVTVDHPQDPCLPVNGAGTCTPTLPPGCDSGAPTLVVSEVRAANVDCEFTTIKPNFDVKITVAYVGPPMGPGSSGSFELVVSNNGPGTAFDVVITDPLPGPLVVTNARGETQECAFVGNVVTCSRGALAPGETWRITVGVQLPVTVPALPANYSNVVSVGALGDEIPANNVDSAAVPPQAPLPATGSNVKTAMRLGWMLLLGGGVLLVAGRRRRRGGAVEVM